MRSMSAKAYVHSNKGMVLTTRHAAFYMHVCTIVCWFYVVPPKDQPSSFPIKLLALSSCRLCQGQPEGQAEVNRAYLLCLRVPVS